LSLLPFETLPAYRFAAFIGPLSMGFSKISGAGNESASFTYAEGGENSAVHVFPAQKTTAGSLRFEKGATMITAPLRLLVGKKLPYPITLMSFSTSGIPAMVITLTECVVKKWSISDFSADENRLLIDTFEIDYGELIF
jgi:phage tail-like protein